MKQLAIIMDVDVSNFCVLFLDCISCSLIGSYYVNVKLYSQRD